MVSLQSRHESGKGATHRLGDCGGAIADVPAFEQQMRRKAHYVIEPPYLWTNIVHLARTQDGTLLDTLQKGFKYIEEQSFESHFQGLFSEINLASDKLGRKYADAASLDAMCAVRRVFDPLERANPGKVLPIHSCREWRAGGVA